MYKRLSLMLIIVSCSFFAIAQSKKTEEAVSGEDTSGKVSYFKVAAGVGNQLLSIHNKALNASESVNGIIFTPSIGYFHKSGLGLSLQGYLLSDSGSTNFYQTSITPSYEYEGNNVAFGISYSHYFVKNKYGSLATPIQNDFYASVVGKKGWINPGVALGYSSGISREINLVTVNIPQSGTVTFPDTTTTKTKAISLIGSLGHTFEFSNVFTKDGDLNFTTSLLANAGSAKFDVTHANRYSAAISNSRTRRGRGRLGGGTGTSANGSEVSKFALQSVGANFELGYGIGQFGVYSQLYLDYYLPQTDSKRFTQVYNITVSYAF